MAWFAFDGYALLRFCGALAVLLLVYYVLFDRKAKYLHCRYYLLSVILLSAFTAILRVPVYPSETVVILATEAYKVPDAVLLNSSKDSGIQKVTQEIQNEDNVWKEEKQLSVRDKWGERFQTVRKIDLFVMIYAVVALILLLRWFLAMMSILRLKKWGSCYRQDGLLIVKNNQVSSPFSFFRMIFINRKLQGETLEVIISHEKSHIEHKHYRDTFLMEMFCIVFWFNPFIWLVKRELKALHEFEVDHCLLANGLELSKYQNIIFDELMGYGPVIANGFHNSMIKKRFIMMKKTSRIRYSLLRKVMLIPAFAGVVALFAFTEQRTVSKRMWVPVMADVPAVDSPALPCSTVEDLPVERREPYWELKLPDMEKKVEEPDTFSVKTSLSTDTVQKYAPFKGREGHTFYPLRDDQVVVSLMSFERREKLKYIETDKKETRLTFAVPIYFNSNWVHFDKGFCIVDRESGDTYMIRSLTRGMELNKTYAVQGKKDRMVEFTMIFPPLKPGVKIVDIYQKFPGMQSPSPSNGSPTCFKNVRIEDYQPPKDIDKYYDREGRPKRAHQVEYLELRSDQIVVSDLPWNSNKVLKSIVTDRKETRVTIAVPIYYDRHWVQFSKGFCIEDLRNGDLYKIRSVDHGIEMNKTLVVVGQKGKMVEFTMVFPRLKKKAKVVNMYTKFREESALTPTNNGGSWEWLGIVVADYNVAKGQIFY